MRNRSFRHGFSVAWLNAWRMARRSVCCWMLAVPIAALSAGAPAKIPPPQIAEKLLTLGAGVWIKKGAAADMVEIKSAAETIGLKFTFARVEFHAQGPDEKPLAAADYDLLDSLTDLPELVLSGEQVNDAVLEKLRRFRALANLTLDGMKISATVHGLLPALPELHELRLIGTGTDDEALKTIAQCRKLKSLHLDTLPVSDAGLAILGKFAALEEVELSTLDKIGSPGFAHLAECRALKTVYVSGITLLSGMVENIAHCKNLENLSLPATVLKDADIAPLVALTKLHYLDLSGSSVSGVAFASWPARLQLTTLNLQDATGVDDAICKILERAFPRIEELNVKLAASGFTIAGAGTLAKVHTLHTLRLGGAGVTDDVVALLARNDGLTTLGIPAAPLSEKGAAALTKIPHLGELSLDTPPLADAALKSFGHCKELKTLNIGKDAPPETESKLHKVLPQLTIHRAEQ